MDNIGLGNCDYITTNAYDADSLRRLVRLADSLPELRGSRCQPIERSAADGTRKALRHRRYRRFISPIPCFNRHNNAAARCGRGRRAQGHRGLASVKFPADRRAAPCRRCSYLQVSQLARKDTASRHEIIRRMTSTRVSAAADLRHRSFRTATTRSVATCIWRSTRIFS